MRLEPRDTAGKPPPVARDKAADKAVPIRGNEGKVPGPVRPEPGRTGVEHAASVPLKTYPVEAGRMSGTGKPGPNPREGASPSPSSLSSRPVRPEAGAFVRLAASLGIPADPLQASILSFSRYFSLPLEPGLLLRLRREVLSLKTPGEAGALGAAAAADKGVELSPQGLEDYAAAIEGFVRDEGEAGGGRRGGAEARDERRPPAGEYPGEGAPEPPSGKDLRERALRTEADLPLPGLLNRLPGREGRYWMVFPFTWSSGGVAFRISLRLLLESDRYTYDDHNYIDRNYIDRNYIDQRVIRLALDIRGDRRRWSFTLDKPGTAGAETRVSLSPPLPAREWESLEAELRGLLGGSVHLAVESPLFGDCKSDTLLSVNEEV